MGPSYIHIKSSYNGFEYLPQSLNIIKNMKYEN